MADVHDKVTRSRNMAAIRRTDTKPEMLIRRGLHANGFRYRLHDRKLPGRPDLVLPKHRAVIFVNGCFWHGHDCPLFVWPKTRQEFWREKISNNTKRDRKNLSALADAGWRTTVVWECALKGKRRLPTEQVLRLLGEWLAGNAKVYAIEGLNQETTDTLA